MQLSSTLLQRLRTHNLRVTPARKALLHTLKQSESALTVKEIAALTDVDQATVYRNLKPLLLAGVIEAITISPKETRYALSHHHHDHAVCTLCHTIKPFECSTQTPPVINGFAQVTHHEVTYYGICTDCSSAP